MKNVPIAINNIIKRHGLKNMNQLALKANVSRAALFNYATGKTIPTYENIQIIRNTLELTQEEYSLLYQACCIDKIEAWKLGKA